MSVVLPGANRPARIGIVEDDAVLRRALARSISAIEEFLVFGVAESLRQGFELAAREPDVLFIDLALPDGTGIDLIRYVRATNPRCRSLVLSVFGDVRNVVTAIEAGADGYLLKGADSDQAAYAIRTVLGGGAPISPAVAGHILDRIRTDKRGEQILRNPVALTPREVDVLEALAKGLSFKEVAQLHSISHHTVADHVKVIYKKLEVNSRAEAVFEAVQSGIIRLSP